MNIVLLGFLLAGLTICSYLFIRSIAFTQQMITMPFFHRIHTPKAMEILTDEEHTIIHEKLDKFNIHAFTVYVASLIGTVCAAFFFALVYYGGNGNVPGYIMAAAFAYVFANYNINTKLIRWTLVCENQLLARAIQYNADAKGFDSLGAYLMAESHKMMEEWFEDLRRISQECEDRMIELGWDPERDYYASEESEAELVAMLEQVENEFAEKYPQPPEK